MRQAIVFAVSTFLFSNTSASQSEIESTRDTIIQPRSNIEYLKLALIRSDTVAARKYAERINANYSIQTAMDSGLVQLGLRNYETAVLHINYVFQAAPDDYTKAEACFYQGLAWRMWGEHFIVADKPDSAHQSLGNSLAYFDSSLTYKNDYHEAWYNRGNALSYLREYEEALASYDNALSYKHDFHDAWTNRGVALIGLDKYDDAVASFDSALTYKQDDDNSWYGRGVALRNLREYDEAIASCDSSIKYNPVSTKAVELRQLISQELKK